MSDVAARNAVINADFQAAAWALPPGKRISLENTVIVFLAIDLLVFLACGWAPSFFFRGGGNLDLGQLDDRAVVIGFAATAYLFMSYAVGGCNARRILDSNDTPRRQAAALAATFLLMILIGAATKTTQNFSRTWFFSWLALSCSILPAVRLGLLAHMRRRLERGDFAFRALSVGVFANPLARAALNRVSGGTAQIVVELKLESLGQLESLAHWIACAEIDQIYIVTPWVDTPAILEQLVRLRQFSTDIFVLPADARVHAHQLGVGVMGDRAALRAANRPINGWNLLAKRVQDIVVASAGLVFFFPVILLVVLAIKIDSPGPLLFRQKRVGFNGRQFELLKFRSMYAHAADAHASRQTARADDRVTRVGRFIRRTSLDELPQLFNVLRGDMSVVGPRPHALLTKTNGVELSHIAEQYAARHRVKPGLTGLAQVNGFRGELDTYDKVRKRVEFDIKYIESWSTWLDVQIILRTAFLMVFDRNAY